MSIPAVAAKVGIEEGDGTNFILGAQSNTIHNINQHDQHQPCIEGVVDLELVSHLVTGVTNSEFVDLLQHDVQHPQHLEEKSEEDQHLLQNSNLPTSSDTAYLSLSADPFVHTLVEVHNHNEKEGAINESEFSVQKSFVSRPRSDTEVSREAFLLSVPKPDGVDASNNQYSSVPDNDTYVLALPETKGVADSLQASTANNDEDAINTRHVFDPLPTDITNLDLRVSIISEGLQEVVHLDVVVDRQVPFIGYVILVSGLFALSSIGAALDLQRGATPEIKIFWRLSTTSILFLMLAAKTNRIRREEFDFSLKEWLELSFASANYALMNTTFAVSLEMTSLINAFILSNMASLIMIGWKFMTGVEVLCFEGVGALIGFVGALVCAAGSDGEGTNEDTSSREYFGDILAFSASIGVAIYLTIAKRLRTKIDLVLFMFLVFSLSSVFLLIYITVCSGQQYEFSFDPSIGLFGWLNLRGDRLPLELYVAIICNGVGTMGYIAILKYFDAVVVSMVMLCEPIVATFIGMVVGVSGFPSIPTWIGNAIIIIGSTMVIRTGSKKSEMIDATNALQHFEEDELNRSVKKIHNMQSPKLMRSPLIVNKQDVEDVEFESVGKKTRTTRGSGSRVVWSSIKCR